MVNVIEDIYKAAYIAGSAKRPIFVILAMPNKEGKSLTAYRFLDHPNVLLLAGDSTTNTTRKKLHRLFKQNKLDKLNLIIIEDWSKVREKVKEGMAAIVTMFSNTIISIDQEQLEIPPTKVHASVIINVPLPEYQEVIKHLLSSGAGDRFTVIKAQLSEDQHKILEKLGILNNNKPLIPITINDIQLNNFNEYANKYLETNKPLQLLNLAYACNNIRKELFDEINELARKSINEITWENIWEEEQ